MRLKLRCCLWLTRSRGVQSPFRFKLQINIRYTVQLIVLIYILISKKQS